MNYIIKKINTRMALFITKAEIKVKRRLTEKIILDPSLSLSFIYLNYFSNPIKKDVPNFRKIYFLVFIKIITI